MRRWIAGAAAAIGALAVWAAGAQASAPRWFSCVKAAKVEKAFTGAYEDSKCSTASPEHNGKFELSEGLGTKTRIAAKGGGVPGGGSGPVFWETALPGRFTDEWKCEKGREEGQVEAPNRIVAFTIRLKGCHPGTSPGQSPGVIVIGPLSGELGYLDEAHTEVGVDLTDEAEPGGVMTQFRGLFTRDFVVRGSMIARITGNINAVNKVFSIALDAREYLGEVEPEYFPVTDRPSFFGGPPDYPLIEQVGGTEQLPPGEHPAGLQLDAKAKGPAVEIKTS